MALFRIRAQPYAQGDSGPCSWIGRRGKVGSGRSKSRRKRLRAAGPGLRTTTGWWSWRPFSDGTSARGSASPALPWAAIVASRANRLARRVRRPHCRSVHSTHWRREALLSLRAFCRRPVRGRYAIRHPGRVKALVLSAPGRLCLSRSERAVAVRAEGSPSQRQLNGGAPCHSTGP
jgi:hypothetical protein